MPGRNSSITLYLIQLAAVLLFQLILFSAIWDASSKDAVIQVTHLHMLYQFSVVFSVIVIQVAIIVIIQKRKTNLNIKLPLFISWLSTKNANRNFDNLFIIAAIIVAYSAYQIVTRAGTTLNMDIDKTFIFIGFFAGAAFFEEMTFRGFYFKLLVLQNQKLKHTAVIAQAIIFALLHLHNPHLNIIIFINITLAGYFLGWIALHNFSYALLFHFFWNFLQVYLFGTNLSGYRFDNHTMNSSWESWPVTIFVFSLICIYIYLMNRKKEVSL